LKLLTFLLLLVAAGLFFIFIDQGLLAGLCLISAWVLALAIFFGKAGKAGKATAEALTKGMGEEAGKAETESPDSSILEEGFKNAGDLAGQQMFAKDKYQFKNKTFSSVGGASQRLIDFFKKAFK